MFVDVFTKYIGSFQLYLLLSREWVIKHDEVIQSPLYMCLQIKKHEIPIMVDINKYKRRHSISKKNFKENKNKKITQLCHVSFLN